MAADNRLAVFLQTTVAADGHPIRLPHKFYDEQGRAWEHVGYVAFSCPKCGEETLEAAGLRSTDCGRRKCQLPAGSTTE